MSLNTQLTDVELNELLASEKFPFKIPDLVDDELKELLAERAAGEVQRFRKIRTGISLITVAITTASMLISCCFFGISYPMYVAALLAFMSVSSIIIFVVGAQKAAVISGAFRDRQYNIVVKLLPKASAYFGFCMPITTIQWRQCYLIALGTLISEGRILEFESQSRYLLEFIKHSPRKKSGSWIDATHINLAVAALLRHDFKAGTVVFEEALNRELSKDHRAIVLNNLALCQAELDQLDQAEKSLDQILELIRKGASAHIKLKVEFVGTLVKLKRGDLEAAEADCMRLLNMKAIQNDVSLLAGTYQALSEVQRKQGRLDEASLHCKNSLDLLSSSDNARYVSLLAAMHLYAKLLSAQGKPDRAKQCLHQAHELYEQYLDREHVTLARLKARLRDPRLLWTQIDLSAQSDRVPVMKLLSMDGDGNNEE